MIDSFDAVLLKIGIYINQAIDSQYYGIFNRLNGYRHGYHIEFFRSSIQSIKLTRNNSLHGIEIGYYSDGSIRWIRQWQRNKLHGADIDFINGKTRWINHRYQGRLHGIEISYYSDGSIYRKIRWVYGKKMK